MTRYSGRSLLGVCGLAVLLVSLASPAGAIGIGDAIIVQPASTLLLPYFEVDLGPVGGGPPAPPACPPGSICAGPAGGGGGGAPAPLGQNTIFHVGNASATATLAHVTIWSDLSVPVFTFDIYLTGYDVQHVDLREVLNGILPRTASAGQDPGNTISPKGPVSQDINFASCNPDSVCLTPTCPPNQFTQIPNATSLPYTNPIDLVRPGSIAHMRNALTGHASALLANQCAGRSFNDNIARGYITMDVGNACTIKDPTSAGYFVNGGGGFAGNRNIIYGDWSIVNPITGGAAGGSLVHMIADAANPLLATAGNYTFYGRYVNWTAIDNRQPLAGTFATRYTNQPPLAGGTSLIVWRDSKVNQGPFVCGVNPPWYPLGKLAVVVFDEQERVQLPSGNPFGAEAQLFDAAPSFPLSFPSGWIFLNLNTTVAAAGANPPIDPVAAQAWVIAVHKASSGIFGGPTVDAVQLDNASQSCHGFPSASGC